MSSLLTKEDVLSIVFNKHEWRMTDFPFGDNKEATIEAMSEYAKQECIAFGKFCVDNAWRINKLVDDELTYTGLHELWEIEKIKHQQSK